MTDTNHAVEPWIASHTAQKQSNYGRYKAGIHRGKGQTFETVNILADKPELALEIARSAALSPDMLAFIQTIARMKQDGEEDENGNEWVMENDDAVTTLNDLIETARGLAAKAKGE